MRHYLVSDETINQATKCLCNFSCLNSDTYDTCLIGGNLFGNFLDIEKKSRKIACPYLFSYGFSNYCTCPVRREVYERYRV
ncbi:MAG TPA: hypothetical protein VK435_00535 [Thermodesulfovibrionales bacterium]|nr:hypothetical protein [Thermodesulfovibrionales bacterium]